MKPGDTIFSGCINNLSIPDVARDISYMMYFTIRYYYVGYIIKILFRINNAPVLYNYSFQFFPSIFFVQQYN